MGRVRGRIFVTPRLQRALSVFGLELQRSYALLCLEVCPYPRSCPYRGVEADDQTLAPRERGFVDLAVDVMMLKRGGVCLAKDITRLSLSTWTVSRDDNTMAAALDPFRHGCRHSKDDHRGD